MARIILSILFLIVLVILIVMNVGSVASVNVFGWVVEELSVTVVGLVSFVAGVIYSFIFYLMSYLERGRRDRLAKKKKKLKDQEADLKSREQEVDDLAQESKRQMKSVRAIEEPSREGPLSNLFGKARRRREPATETIDQPTEESTTKPKKK